jgi:zinc protease
MNEDFRQAAPAPLDPKPFSLSQPTESKLTNGLKVVVFEERRLPIVSFRLAFQTGEIYDSRGSIGLTSATMHLLNQGTASRTSRQIADDIERLGASFSASSSSDNTVIAASSLSMFTEELTDLLADIVLNPIFPENEVALYKKNSIELLKSQRAQAGFLADEQISKIIYGEHPYSIVSPTAADIEKISRESLVDCRARTIIPNKCIVVVVGDVDTADILKRLETLFGSWKAGTTPADEFTPPPARSERTLTVVDRAGSAQSNIVLSNLAIKRSDPDYFPAIVMNQILGAGASSRLFMNLREEKGYTYGAYSSFDSRRLAGAFEATAEVRTPVTGDSLKEFFLELNKMRDADVSADELKDAQSFLTGVFPIRAETQEGLTNLIVTQQLYDLPEDYLQTYRDNINAVTVEEVRRVAQKYLMPDKMAIVIVGDAEDILPQAKLFAENVNVVDTEGAEVDITKYGRPGEAASVDVSGEWAVSLNFQGQNIPVTLELTQEGNTVSGTMESMLGTGQIDGGKIRGNKMNAVAVIEVQSQKLELQINASLENESLSGTIETAMIPTPVEFSGTKKA